MPRFTYQAIDQSGARTLGEVVAADQIAALDMIAGKGLTPLEVTNGGHTEPWWNRDLALFGGAKLKPKEIEAFFSSLSTMLAAKTPLPRALQFSIDMTKDTLMKSKLRAALTAVEDGMPFADALADGPVSFPDQLTTMVRLGEASNSLDVVANRAAKMLETEARLRSELQHALIYPIILLMMSVLVLSVLVFYLAPTLGPVFASADTPPPAIIGVMLWTQKTLTSDWPLILAAMMIVGSLVYAIRDWAFTLLGLIIRLVPGVRQYLSKRDTLLLLQTIYLILSSGGQLNDAIRTAATTARQTSWKTMLVAAHRNIEAGQTMSEALLDDPRIDQMGRSILKTGEEADQLVAVLEPAIATLETQTSQMMSQVVKMLTPVLTLVIGFTVGAIILSTISAIMDLNDVVL